MKAQVAPRPIGLLLGLQGTLNPFSMCAYKAIQNKPLAEKVAIMRDPEFRAVCWRKRTSRSLRLARA